jgi:hypothetical protein
VKSVGRGGGVLSGPASFLAQWLSNLNGVLNIAEAAVSPSSVTEFKRLNRRLCSSSAAY